MDETIVLVQEIWKEVSSEPYIYTSAKTFRTLAVTPKTTIKEVMQWAEADVIGTVIERGDVILTKQCNGVK
jgi:hypothetical protein